MNRRVLLVGWDAADWRMIQPLLDAGEMPALAQVIDRGVMGNIASLSPMISPMLWTSIATGRRAHDHGICGFVEPREDGGVQPARSVTRRCKAIWNILAQNGLRCQVVNWLATDPAEPLPGGVVVPHGFLQTNSGGIHPGRLEETMAALRVSPSEITGDILQPFVPRAGEIDQSNSAARRPLEILADLMARTAGTHAAATWLLENEPWDFAAVYYEAIDHAGHAFMPFHPPRMPGLDVRLYELYHGVMAGWYRFHDMMLARLMELAGEDAVVMVVSDHGFHCNHLRPGSHGESLTPNPLAWHRPHGILAMSGPGIVADERFYGATLLDVTPTILTLFGLACGSDMPGRALVEVTDPLRTVLRIPSWESVPGECGQHPEELRCDPQDAREIVRQLVALGYLEENSENGENAARDWQFNLALSWLDGGRPEEAVKILGQVAGNDARALIALAQARLAMGDPAGARTAALQASLPEDSPERNVLLAMILLAEGCPRLALSRLRQAEHSAPRLPRLHNQIGAVYLRRRQWRAAQRAFRKALDIDPESAAGWEGLAGALLRLNRPEDAIDAALHALGLQHYLPAAHLHLGRALLRTGNTARGLEALDRAAAMRPNARTLQRFVSAIQNLLVQ